VIPPTRNPYLEGPLLAAGLGVRGGLLVEAVDHASRVLTARRTPLPGGVRTGQA
jgi:hypothetical protein